MFKLFSNDGFEDSKLNLGLFVQTFDYRLISINVQYDLIVRRSCNRIIDIEELSQLRE